MSPKIQVRSDAQDVAQSALRTFFEQAMHQKYAVERAGDFVATAAAITVNKAKQHVQFHRAASVVCIKRLQATKCLNQKT